MCYVTSISMFRYYWRINWKLRRCGQNLRRRKLFLPMKCSEIRFVGSRILAFRDTYITNSSPMDKAAILPVYYIVNMLLILHRSLIHFLFKVCNDSGVLKYPLCNHRQTIFHNAAAILGDLDNEIVLSN